MYNRYIPQPDGTYLRSRQQERESTPPPQVPCPPDPPNCPPSPAPEPRPQLQAPVRPPHSSRYHRNIPPKQDTPSAKNTGIGSFLKQLLPKGLDTGDLIVILLLLLMSSDCQDDQNTALLTLALYLFL